MGNRDSNKLTDREIINFLIAGDEQIVEYFFYEKCSSMFGYIVKEVFGYHVNKDELVSELYIYLQENNWSKVRKFNYQSRFTTWLSVVAVRFFIKKRAVMIDSDWQKAQIDEIRNIATLERYDTFIVKMDIYTAINKLSNPRERFVLMAIEIEGRDDKAVADLLGIEVANLYNIKSRAKKHLSNIIKENYYVN